MSLRSSLTAIGSTGMLRSAHAKKNMLVQNDVPAMQQGDELSQT